MTKEQQLNHNRIKPKKEPMFGKKPSSFSASKKSVPRIKPKYEHSNSGKADGFKDPEYLAWLHKIKKPFCCLCGRHHVSSEQDSLNYTEMHHIKSHDIVGRDDSKVIPLCGDTCHRIGKHSIHASKQNFALSYDEQIRVADGLYSEYLRSTVPDDMNKVGKSDFMYSHEVSDDGLLD